MSELKEQIVTTAVALAEEQGWEAVRLYEVADRLGVGLDAIRGHFPEKDHIIDAFFDRADRAMLLETERPDFLELPPRDRIHRLIMVWLETLAPHRRVVREMLNHKLELGHLHVQIPAVIRISQTVQWVREGARREDTFFFRGLEETGLTSTYLITFAYWLGDQSYGAEDTRRLLDRLLATGQRTERLLKPWLERLPLPTLQPGL